MQRKQKLKQRERRRKLLKIQQSNFKKFRSKSSAFNRDGWERRGLRSKGRQQTIRNLTELEIDIPQELFAMRADLLSFFNDDDARKLLSRGWQL